MTTRQEKVSSLIQKLKCSPRFARRSGQNSKKICHVLMKSREVFLF